MIRKLSITWKIVIPIALVIITLLTSLSVYNYIHMKEVLFGQIEDKVSEVSHRVSGDISNFVNDGAITINNLKSTIEIYKDLPSFSREKISSLLGVVLKQNPSSVGVWISGAHGNKFDDYSQKYSGSKYGDSTGRVAIWWTQKGDNRQLEEPVEYNDDKDEIYFKKSFESGRPELLDPYLDEVGDGEHKLRLMTSYTNVVNDNGNVTAILGIDLMLSTIQAKMAGVKPFKDSKAFLISNSYKYISHPTSSKFNTEIDSTFDKEFKIKQRMKSNKKFIVRLEESIMIFRPVKFQNIDSFWYIAIEVSNKSIYGEAINSLIIQSISIILATLILISLIIFITKIISKKLINIVSELNNSSQHLVKTSSDLKDTSDEFTELSVEQTKKLDSTNCDLENITAKAGENNSIADNVLEFSKKIEKTVYDSNNHMISLKKVMTEINESNKKIEEFETIIKNIASKTAIMDEIVFQTKLLSFNASVEAERAGESGRGFSVVAQEVGNLASLSGKSANEISSIVEGSILEIRKIIAGHKAKSSEVSKYINEIDSYLDSIKQNTELVGKEVGLSCSTSKVQLTNVHSISKTLDGLENINDKKRTLITATNYNSDILKTQSDTLNKIVVDIKDIVNGSS